MNKNILNQVSVAGAQLLAVTKYLSPQATTDLLPGLENDSVVLGFGENRVASLMAKNLPREFTHFIGRLQSRQFPQIIHHCGTIHSLEKLSHANKINEICLEKELLIKIFIQINISQEPQKGGIKPADLPEFISALKTLKNLEVIGLSGMGSLDTKNKMREFKLLKDLRDQYMPTGLISAGTSSDYVLALAEGIDIVRVGRKLWV